MRHRRVKWQQEDIMTDMLGRIRFEYKESFCMAFEGDEMGNMEMRLGIV